MCNRNNTLQCPISIAIYYHSVDEVSLSNQNHRFISQTHHSKVCMYIAIMVIVNKEQSKRYHRNNWLQRSIQFCTRCRYFCSIKLYNFRNFFVEGWILEVGILFFVPGVLFYHLVYVFATSRYTSRRIMRALGR